MIVSPQLACRHVNDADPQGYANLRRGNPHRPGAGTHGVYEIRDEGRNVMVHGRDRPADLFQDGMGIE